MEPELIPLDRRLMENQDDTPDLRIRWNNLSVFGRCVIAACLMATAGTLTIPLTLLVLAISHSLDFLPYGGTAFVLLVVGAVILFCYGMAWGIWVENDYPEQ